MLDVGGEHAQLHHLLNVVVPVGGGEVAAGAVGFDVVVTVEADLGAGGAAEDVDHGEQAHALVGAQGCADGFLCEDGAVEALGWIAADVAVVAVVVHLLAKVVHEDAAAADLGLGVLLHLVELFAKYQLLRRFRLFDESSASDYVLV